ncbi:mugineic-acid 3-dioxygenase-like [Aegilops tauschii subsp. strangulata]|uniref:Fe2OG dioxygenase domain-containing protein n=1 Tax=Aegilops tauschii subsp. strangulata TaxID=200361 RepID=A0A453MN71_AEGTS|nr:mugineic-acid 3-dioxygenase-like [Aegilops tauschii subsp. strangulata]XP_044415863.1 mugineic-acid 3-dioxygenase-like [Triticum aestivum]
MRTQTMRLRCDLPAHNSVRYTSRNQVKMKTPTTKLMFDLPAHNSVPDKYIMPAEKRPRRHELVDDGLSVALPVVDLKKGRPQVARDILEAGKEFGFFQVVNHGVGEDVVQGFREVAAEFLRLPEEAKLEYYSEDQSKAFRVISGCITSHKLMNEWPTQPEIFRERLANYSVAVQELAWKLLRLIAEELGLDDHNFFKGDLTGGETLMNVHYYPLCPDPNLTMGVRPHSDRYIITVLSQGDVGGLQAKIGGRWIGVEPIHNAFVINFGLQMEINQRASCKRGAPGGNQLC